MKETHFRERKSGFPSPSYLLVACQDEEEESEEAVGVGERVGGSSYRQSLCGRSTKTDRTKGANRQCEGKQFKAGMQCVVKIS